MIKLTKAGKIVVGVVGVLLCALIYFMFFRPAPPPPTDEAGVLLTAPGPVPKPYSFPLKGKQAEVWQQKASKRRSQLTHCAFLTRSVYQSSRTKELDFVGIIPKDATESPYYYLDPKGGREYFPVLPIGPGSEGVKYAVAAAGGDTQAVDPCTGGVPIMVAFPEGTNPPQSGLIRVLGYMAWTSDDLNMTSPPPATTTVVNAGSVKEASLQQALAPATRERMLNVVVRRGPVEMRVGRIEFASNQTRVWVSLINRSAEPVDGFQVARATLEERGRAPQPASTSPLPGARDLGSRQEQTDLLENKEIPPPSGRAGKLEGFITFPAVNPSALLTLRLPDPYPSTGGQGEQAISIQLRPQANQAV